MDYILSFFKGDPNQNTTTSQPPASKPPTKPPPAAHVNVKPPTSNPPKVPTTTASRAPTDQAPKAPPPTRQQQTAQNYEDNEYNQQFQLQSQLPQQHYYNDLVIKEREAGIKEIEQGLMDLHGTMKDLHSIVGEQQRLFDMIEENTSEAAYHTSVGIEELEIAEKHNANTTGWGWWNGWNST